MRIESIVALNCVALIGCAAARIAPSDPPRASLTRFDTAFQLSPGSQPPLVVLDDKELAKAPIFKAVGVLQLTGNEKSGMAAFYEAVVAAGQAAGCEVLYQRDAFELGTRIPKPLMASGGGIGAFIATSGREWRRSDQLVWQFLCGVTGATGDEQEQSMKQGTSVAIDLRRKALGDYEPCEQYIPTGSHILRREVCANDPKNRRGLDGHSFASSNQ